MKPISTKVNSDVRQKFEQRLKADLARLLDCEPDTLPASCDKKIACKFLGLGNPKTLNFWNSTGRHGIVMVKVGKRTEASTDWLISLKLAGLKVPAEVD